jgi:SAM-dependent methyltransferase
VKTAAPRKLGRVLESKEPLKRSFDDYRQFVQQHYDGLPGALTAITGWLTGHEPLAARLFRPGAFDIRGRKQILDAGCGNGRHTQHLIKEADVDAVITAFDYSQGMLNRARKRPGALRANHVAADITRLPYADRSFDAAVCGWVLEHLPDERAGLAELARVLQPGAKMLLMVTEDTLLGAVCSRLWHCRTYNRARLRRTCAICGLGWYREFWFSRPHAWLRLGGIIVELVRED